MDIVEIKRLIRVFNKTHDPVIYGKLLDINHRYRPKCKCCGNDIIYPQTKVRLSKNNEVYSVDGCYKTIKKIDGIEYQLGVCWECLSKKFQILNPSRCFNVMSEATKFAFNIPDDQFEKCRSNYALTRKSFVEKYGEELGNKKWDQYCKRQAETNTFEFKQKKYGWSKKEFEEYNKSRATTLKNFIKRYGEELGNKKWDQYCKRQAETKSWDYMVEHFGEEKARNILRQRASHNRMAFSKISQQLFKELDEYLAPRYTTQYATKGGEYKIEYDRWVYSLDYYIKELNVCVEFNGGIWHADPKLFGANDHPNPMQPNLTSKDIWEHDKFRGHILKTLGIKTYIIWENEYPNIDLKLFAKKIINENK